MIDKPIYFIENKDGDFIVVNEYGEPILDENGKEIDYTGDDRYICMNKVYVSKNRANNYVRDYGDNKYKKGVRNGVYKKNYKSFKR